MDFKNLSGILAMGPPQAPPGKQINQTGEMIRMMGMLALFVVMMYFVLFRPQQKRARQQAEMLKSVKAGDRIVTTGGIIATVVTVKEKSLSIRSADAKMEISKSAIAEITERSGDSGPSQSSS